MIIGGGAAYPSLSTSSQFFNPATSSFTAGPGLLQPRLNHTATILATGSILIAGGRIDWSTNEVTSRVELYDALLNTFASFGDMRVGRQQHAADRLSSGRVLVTTGFGESLAAGRSVEQFDPASVGFRIVTTSLPDGFAGVGYTATSLQAVGGLGGASFGLAGCSLPPGMSLNQNGTLGGTPGAGGRYDFSVTESPMRRRT